MKRILSISLGSSKRDFHESFDAGGIRFDVRRIGVDGDTLRAAELIKTHDQKADAIGLGGVNINYVTANRRYSCPAGLRLKRMAQKCPVVDGELFKRTYEATIPLLLQERGFEFERRGVLCVSALDRWELARAFEAQKANVMIGDAAFALGIPLRFSGLKQFSYAANLSMWALSRMPIKTLYPHKGQKRPNPRLFRDVDYVAGDYHLIRRRAPKALAGVWVLTSTTTEQNRSELVHMGIKGLVTMTQPFGKRTFGANVFDACAAALFGTGVTDEQSLEAWRMLALRPHVWRIQTPKPETKLAQSLGSVPEIESIVAAVPDGLSGRTV